MEIYICICVCISHCAAANTRPFKCMLITADLSVNEKYISIVWGWSQPSVPGLLQQRRGRGCCRFRLAKRRDWHRMDECSLGQSAVAGYQSGLINGALRRKQMPPSPIVPINRLPPPSFTADLDEAAGGHRRPVGVAASPAIKVHLLAIFFSDKRQKNNVL